MYGYNAGVRVQNASQYDKTYYGATLGAGLDLQNSDRKNHWTFAILVPLRSDEVQNYMDYLEKTKNVNFPVGLFPVTISVGYIIGL